MTTAAAASEGVDWRTLPLEAKKELLARLQAEREAAVRRRWPTPFSLARELEPASKNPPHLAAIDDALIDVLEGRCERLLITMPPQEGKSERTSHYGALWALLQRPELRIAIASYEAETARRWGQVIRNDLLTFNLPLELQEDSRAAGRWNVRGHKGGVYCVGIGGALTGRPVDMLLIDDPVKDRAQADSLAYRDAAWNWWTDVARTRLAPGAPAILIMTRWHEDDLAGRILRSEGGSEWRVLRIPAQADSEDDPIGRAPGEYLPSAREWPEGRWESVKRDIGSRSWNALYQGIPSAEAGNVFLRQWWQWYDEPIWETDENGVCRIPGAAEVIQSWDLTFKDGKGSDWVVGQVWAKIGADAFLVDQIRRRMDFPATLESFALLSARWPQATTKVVEEAANGAALISSMRSSIPGITPVKPTESKIARANAVSPFVESSNVWLPTERVRPWIDEFVTEATAFPNGAHDDQVDGATQALKRIFLDRRRARLIA